MAMPTMAQIEDDYIAMMGTPLGSNFFQLHRKLVQLHVLWQQYRQLFGATEETVDLLNRHAGLFFRIVQDEFWDSVLLGIARMTDPPATRKDKNLTIQSLPALITDAVLRADVEVLCKDALDAAAPAREHRNKRIAHQDHQCVSEYEVNQLTGISREMVEKMLAALSSVLNRIEIHFKKSAILYEHFLDLDGSRVLVEKLRRLEQLETHAIESI